MKKQTKEDLRWLAAFTVKGILGALVLTAALVGISALVEYVLGPVLGAALWGAWESVNSWL
ncbi:MAG: hypothetical protein IJP43_06045 [Oscillospiraceae bacterium]|nr:hypothetical protein [Oscillospiraceae bacterium]